MSTDRGTWDTLLHWLEAKGMDTSENGLLVERRSSQDAGYGLFVSKACSPSTVLFSVPQNALINVKTLSRIYERGSLTAVQMISLHLALSRHITDPHFGPYISVLPADFSFHPLTWLDQKNSVDRDKFVSLLTPSVLKALYELQQRFSKDLTVVTNYLTERLPISKVQLLENYQWAWLNVNTRCIYLRLKADQSHPDNLTMCPILDMANHSGHLPSMTARPTSNPPRLMSFQSPQGVHLAAGDEVFLQYGAHSNTVLFVEYGFTRPISGADLERGEVSAEADITHLLEALFSKTERCSLLKSILEKDNYWGNWTLHATQDSAYPSFRVVTALRLYHLVSDSSYHDGSLYIWKDMISGARGDITSTNEAATRETLQHLCRQLEERGRCALQDVQSWKRATGNSDTRSMADTITNLWREEILVARHVYCSIERGVSL